MNAAMAGDELTIENINMVCRPMTVAEDYSTFTSDDWLDAKEELETTSLSSPKQDKLLCCILTVRYDVTTFTFPTADT